jgi:hypothetical protein
VFLAVQATNSVQVRSYTGALVANAPDQTGALRLTLNPDKSTYSYGGNELVTAHLGATHDSRRVDIFATPYNGSRQLIKSGNVNASGNLAVHYSVTRATTFTAAFAADDRYASRTVTHIKFQHR